MISPKYNIGRKLSSIGGRPVFYLVYLVFYFVPWLMAPPSGKEIVFTAVIISLFLPVHFLSFAKTGRKNIVLIAIMEIFSIMTAPMSGGSGVFHIYAAAQAGYQKSATVSAMVFVIISAVYMLSAYVFDRHVYEIIFVSFMAGIIWITCMQENNQISEAEEKERARELEKQQASITERERIARDLHDLLGHTLTMVSLKSDLSLKFLDKDPEAARAEIIDIGTSSRKALSDIRAVLSGINRTTLMSEINNAKRALETAEISLNIQGDIPKLDFEQEQVAALTIRESVTNIIRHSNASEVTLSFSMDPQDNFIQIVDNGIGSTKSAGQGLLGLKDRVSKIGGSTVIDLTQGARISVVLPLPAAFK